jgi:hypothetical protein
MVARTDLLRRARAHLRDAEILVSEQRYDGAVYLCGYAVEIALKARICRTLKWSTFPPAAGTDRFKSFLTHNFETLLLFSGIEDKIKPALAAEWSKVKDWNPEQRYNPVGTQNRSGAEDYDCCDAQNLARLDSLKEQL